MTFFNAGDKVRLNEGMDCADTQEFIDKHMWVFTVLQDELKAKSLEKIVVIA